VPPRAGPLGRFINARPIQRGFVQGGVSRARKWAGCFEVPGLLSNAGGARWQKGRFEYNSKSATQGGPRAEAAGKVRPPAPANGKTRPGRPTTRRETRPQAAQTIDQRKNSPTTFSPKDRPRQPAMSPLRKKRRLPPGTIRSPRPCSPERAGNTKAPPAKQPKHHPARLFRAEAHLAADWAARGDGRLRIIRNGIVGVLVNHFLHLRPTRGGAGAGDVGPDRSSRGDPRIVLGRFAEMGCKAESSQHPAMRSFSTTAMLGFRITPRPCDQTATRRAGTENLAAPEILWRAGITLRGRVNGRLTCLGNRHVTCAWRGIITGWELLQGRRASSAHARHFVFNAILRNQPGAHGVIGQRSTSPNGGGGRGDGGGCRINSSPSPSLDPQKLYGFSQIARHCVVRRPAAGR